MAFISIPASWIQVGKAMVQRLFQRIKDDLDALFSSVGVLQGTDILNGFFEIVEDITAIKLRPSSWDITEYLGGTVELDDGSSRKGQYALKFNHPGGAANGGGEAESDYYALSPDKVVSIAQTFWSTNAGVRIKVLIDYFDEDKIFIIASTETLYNVNSGNPTAAKRLLLHPTIPAGARYLKYKFVGGDTDTDPGVSTNIFLDEVTVNAIDDGAITQEKLGYQPGAALIFSTPGINSSGTLVYVMLRETEVVRNGIITVSYDFTTNVVGGSRTVESIIRINGVDAMAEVSDATGIYQTVSRDLVVKAGDLVQVWGKVSGTTPNACLVKNFNFYNLHSITESQVL